MRRQNTVGHQLEHGGEVALVGAGPAIAEVRLIALPTKADGLIQIRMRQQAEWLPNGRSIVWFDPATGAMVASRDALGLPLGSRIANLDYPLHAARVGGLPYRLVMTASGWP